MAEPRFLGVVRQWLARRGGLKPAPAIDLLATRRLKILHGPAGRRIPPEYRPALVFATTPEQHGDIGLVLRFEDDASFVRVRLSVAELQSATWFAGRHD